MTVSRMIYALALAGLLSACGQRGPLYLPDEPAPPAGTANTQDPLETGLENKPEAQLDDEFGDDEPDDESGDGVAADDAIHSGSFEADSTNEH